MLIFVLLFATFAVSANQGDNSKDEGWSDDYTPGILPGTPETIHIYTITFQNYDGTVISKQEYRFCDAIIEPDETPQRPADKIYTYEFAGWDGEITIASSDKIFTATYTSALRNYTVTFKDHNGKVLSTKKDYHYGDKIVEPTAPIRNASNSVAYTFIGWDKEVSTCKANAVYTAKYKATPKLSAPSKVSATLYGHDDIMLSWSKVKDAKAYNIYYKKSTQKSYTYLARTTATSYKKANLADGVKYDFKVVPCVYVDKKYIEDNSYKTVSLYTTVNLSAPSKVSPTLYGHDDIKLSWSKVKSAKAYSIYYKKSTQKSYTYLARTTATSYKKANLADGVRYDFKIVPCTYVNGKYFEDDSYKTASIYTLKAVSAPKITKKSKTQVKISWTNISGESGYEISVSTSKSKNGTIYRTTSSTKNLTVKRNKTYYYKVRAYKTVNGKRIYAGWSSVKAYKLK